MRKYVVFLSAVICALLIAPCAYAVTTGLDAFEAGFGPKVKGFQLGEHTTFVEFMNKTLTENTEEVTIHVFESNVDIEIDAYVYTKTSRAGSLKMRFNLKENSWVLESCTGVLEPFSTYSGTLSDAMEEIDKEIEKYPSALVTLTRTPKYIGMEFKAIKNNNAPLRYVTVQFDKIEFGADGMSTDSFVQELVNNYPLGTLYKGGFFYSTKDDQNYKNGWSAYFQSDNRSLHKFNLSVSPILTSGSFD